MESQPQNPKFRNNLENLTHGSGKVVIMVPEVTKEISLREVGHEHKLYGTMAS